MMSGNQWPESERKKLILFFRKYTEFLILKFLNFIQVLNINE